MKRRNQPAKKYLIVCTLIFILFFTGIWLKISQNHESLLQSQIIDGKNIEYNSYVQEDKIIVNTYKGEEETFITGVNIGLGKPGYYPGDIGINKQEYLRWFLQISEMNVNFIRVYTLQSPDSVSYTHLRAHETRHDLVCRLLLENKKKLNE